MGIRGEKRDSSAIKVTLVGLGNQGLAVARAVSTRDDMEIVAALDDVRAGKRLRALDDCPTLPDIEVSRRAPGVLREGRGGVMLFTGCEGSLERCAPLLEEAAREGLNVVSTCAELVYPFLSQPKIAQRIDDSFRAGDVTCLGVGFHPGFIMDRLPVFMGGALGLIRHVSVTMRRDLVAAPTELARRCGVGMTLEEFESRSDEEAMGPPGLIESALLIADGLGIEAGEVEFRVEPSIAEGGSGSGSAAGRLAGIRQEVQIFSDGREVLRLELALGGGVVGPAFELRIDAQPPVHLTIPGPIDEVAATAWAVVNTASQVVLAEPGLMTVLDLPLSAHVPNEDEE